MMNKTCLARAYLQRLKKYNFNFSAFLFLSFLLVISIRPAISAEETNAQPLSQPVGDVLLVIDGMISNTNHGAEAHLDLNMILSLPEQELYTSTVVTDGVKHFKGVLMRDLLQLVAATGTVAEARALNHYQVDIPTADFYEYDVILATHMDGHQLLPSDKGPFWIVYPRDQQRKLQDIRYDYRWVWQLNRMTIK